MVEITATEQNIGKKNEKKQDNLRDNIKHTKRSHYRGPRRRQEKRPEKIFKEIIAKNFLNMGKGTSQPSPGNTESPRQDKPKEEHTEMHSNQTDKN